MSRPIRPVMAPKARMNRHAEPLLFMTAACLLLAFSCMPFAPEPRPAPEGDLPEGYSIPTAPGERAERWWETFGDPELNLLVARALAENFGLKAAWARLRQANALAARAGSALYPDLELEAEISRGRRRSTAGPDTGTRSVEDHGLGLFAAYEADLWGRIRSLREAALLDAAATLEDLRAAGMSVAAAVAERWVRIISQRMQMALLREQLETNRTYLDLVELRFGNALASAVDVYQQKGVVEGVRAQIPLVEARAQILTHELALLLGGPPTAPMELSRRVLPDPRPVPAAGLPADLLRLRPDVRAAALRLRSADWRTSGAKADRLPALRLTGRARYGDAELDRIFDNWLLNLAAGLTAPLLDGGRRTAEADRTEAAAAEALWEYRRTAYTAVREVEDALVSETKRREHIEALVSQIEAARKGLDQARERYRRGLSGYLPVLTQLLTVQRLERDLVIQRTELLLDRIALHRALGGTWMYRFW